MLVLESVVDLVPVTVFKLLCFARFACLATECQRCRLLNSEFSMLVACDRRRLLDDWVI